jgi:hypothetical protein
VYSISPPAAAFERRLVTKTPRVGRAGTHVGTSALPTKPNRRSLETASLRARCCLRMISLEELLEQHVRELPRL